MPTKCFEHWYLQELCKNPVNERCYFAKESPQSLLHVPVPQTVDEGVQLGGDHGVHRQGHQTSPRG